MECYKDNVMLPYVSMTNCVVKVRVASLSVQSQWLIKSTFSLTNKNKKAQNSSELCAFLGCFVVKMFNTVKLCVNFVRLCVPYFFKNEISPLK